MAASARQDGPFTVEGEGIRGPGTVALVAPSEPAWYRAVILELRDVLNTVHQRGAIEDDLHGERPDETPPEDTGQTFEVRPDE
jgi:hypothetical protein